MTHNARLTGCKARQRFAIEVERLVMHIQCGKFIAMLNQIRRKDEPKNELSTVGQVFFLSSFIIKYAVTVHKNIGRSNVSIIPIRLFTRSARSRT